MTDRRCGTCRHWKRYQQTYGGTCGVLSSLGSTAHVNEDHTGCPGWSDGDDYARGWRDAVAAAADAAAATVPVYPRDTQYAQLGDAAETQASIIAAIAALTPPG